MKSFGIWVLVASAMLAQGGFRGPGRYEIYSPLSQKVMDMDRNDQRTVIQYESRRTDNQTWEVSDAGGGYYYIRNAMNGNALAVRDDRNSTPLVAEPFSSAPQQRWRIEGGDNGTAILVNANGKAIDIPFGSTNNGVKLNSYSRNNEVNQRWQFQAVGGGFGVGRGGRGVSRYDLPQATAPAPVYGRRDADGMYFDDRERTYKLDGDGVCFYRDRNFQGEAVCATLRNGRGRWNSSTVDFDSVRFFGRATAVQVFDRDNFRGNAVEITQDERNVNRTLRNYLRGAPQSMRVY